MLLMPRKVKFRKTHKGKSRGIATTGHEMHFGEFGLKAIENGWIRGNHLEACRVVIARKMKGAGKLWFNIFPDKPITKKPAETRMGKGKGESDHWVAVIKRGRVIMELSGVPEDFAKSVLRLVAFKLPIKTRLIVRGA